MAIEFVRIDDRLIHGQVMTTWVKTYDIEQIIIVDDAVSADETRKKVLGLSAPSNIKLVIFDVDKFIDVANSNSINRRTLLLLAEPSAALRLYDGEVQFKELNVGNISVAGDRVKITQGVAVNETDKKDFKELINRGVDITIQMVPNDKKLNMKDYV